MRIAFWITGVQNRAILSKINAQRSQHVVNTTRIRGRMGRPPPLSARGGSPPPPPSPELLPKVSDSFESEKLHTRRGIGGFPFRGQS